MPSVSLLLNFGWGKAARNRHLKLQTNGNIAYLGTGERKQMNIYCLQTNIVWEDKKANFAVVRQMIEAQKPLPGSLVVLPEMFAAGFSMNVSQIQEEPPCATEAFLAQIAREFRVTIVGGFIAKGVHGKGLNQSLAFNPDGKLLARYSKIHPFTLSKELQHYIRGEEIVMFEWQGLKVCPFICYDLRFPELFRSAVADGAEMFVVIANWPAKRINHWLTLLQARAIENLAFVVGVNRAGKDPNHTYPGRSVIVDPHGKVLMDAGEKEGIFTTMIDPQEAPQWRSEFPALEDMHWT
ncbi:MAG: carbon-nitrogen family hydrolase [Verrucomicrobiales bacterium]